MDPSVEDRYWKSYAAGWLHCLSTAVAWQVQGWICGPEKTGPPFGGLVIVSRAAWTPAAATTGLTPLRSPVSRPWHLPLGRTANALDTSRPFTVTRAADTPRGRSTCTSASPPEIRSARLDRVRIPSPEPPDG